MHLREFFKKNFAIFRSHIFSGACTPDAVPGGGAVRCLALRCGFILRNVAAKTTQRAARRVGFGVNAAYAVVSCAIITCNAL